MCLCLCLCLQVCLCLSRGVSPCCFAVSVPIFILALVFVPPLLRLVRLAVLGPMFVTVLMAMTMVCHCQRLRLSLCVLPVRLSARVVICS